MSQRPADANATRSVHLRRLYRHPAAITVAAVAVIAAIVVALAVNAIAGAGGGLGLLLLLALVLWVIADAKAEEDFFAAYAAERGLTTGGGQGAIPPATDLLRQGVRRYTDRAFAGKLAGRVDGLLAYYTYETETRDSKGRKQVQYHNFTVVLTALPESVPLLGELALQRRSGFRFFDSAEDKFRSRQRVELESEELDRRYEIFIGQTDDMNKAKQLFSPVFIDWLATGDDDMGFELEGGMLALNIPGQHDTAEELDALCEAAAEIHERISEESIEGSAPAPPPPSFDPASYVTAAEAGKTSARMKRRLWSVVGIVAIGVGATIGLVSSESEESTDSGPSYITYKVPGTGQEDSRFDLRMLARVERLDKGNGVAAADLTGPGADLTEAYSWVFQANTRGLVELTDDFTYVLTKRGERELAKSGG